MISVIPVDHFSNIVIQTSDKRLFMQELLSDAFASKLKQLAKDNAELYKNGKPFPHIYFDDFLPVEAAEAALREFPEPKQLKWSEFDNPNERKLAFDVVERLPTGPRDVLYFLNSRPMVEFLEVLTGIKGVIPDPYFVGGGLHQIKPGGKLAVHADFNHHDKLNLDRRINVLLYMNKDWKEEYGGHFELWNLDMTAAEQKILPLFNRCAIFSTTSYSYHGHPTPLSCPPDRTRKSIATYYYTNGRPEEEVHESHSTLFVQRPEEVDEKKETLTFKKIVYAFSPPILTSAYKKLRK
jgi:Rps23 Pro-64 3,4-dihydroxylase Tpa1-like proline 4-hydroxylase